MILEVSPLHPLRGTVSLPGDKSISHRAALLAGMAAGESKIENFLDAGVTRVMLDGLQQLGVAYALEDNHLVVTSPGMMAWHTPEKALNCGNSGTTMRLLTGALAAANLEVVLDGSEGLRRRPMGRVTDPLRAMGVSITSSVAGTAPLRIEKRDDDDRLKGITHNLRVASAQVKSAILLAALAADSPTTIVEPGPSRDHTERMFGGLGWDVQREELPDGVQVCLTPPRNLEVFPLQMTVPGDFSSAAFLIVAAAITPGSEITLQGVGLNPTRTGLLEVLRQMGAAIDIRESGLQGGEPIGDITVSYSSLHGIAVAGDIVVRMIDEFPVFAVAAAYAEGSTTVSEAEELRHKETDRIAVLAGELRKLGVAIEEKPDGYEIAGQGGLKGGEADACGDHRLGMSLAVAGLASENPVRVDGAEIISESFPEFVEKLSLLGGVMGQVSG